MYEIKRTRQFKKDIKRAKKRGLEMALIKSIILSLAAGEPLSLAQRDHNLSGNWANYRECHIQSNCLLIYRIVDHYLVLERTGTHSDLFE